MSDSYKEVVKGGLRLKGALGIKKGKIQKTKSSGSTLVSVASTSRVPANDPTANIEIDEEAIAPSRPTQYTPAEEAFIQSRKKKEQERVQEVAKKTHRDKISEFNKYLSKLSEYHDIPRVGPG